MLRLERVLISPTSSFFKLVPNPQLLYAGDSETVTVTGTDVDFSTLKDVLFDSKPYFTPLSGAKLDATKLALLVSTDVTKTPGKKEFTVELADPKGGTPSRQTFTLEVVRR